MSTERSAAHRAVGTAVLEKAMENALYAFDIVSAEGRFIHVNKAYVKLWGYDSADEILGTSPVSHCVDPKVPLRLIEALKNDGSCVLEFEARRKDGSTFDVLMYARLDHDEHGNEIYPTTSIDITEKNLIQARLVDSEARLRAILENTPDHVLVIDREATIRYINYTAPGFDRSAVLGTCALEHLSPDSRRVYARATADAANGITSEPIDLTDVNGRVYRARFVPLESSHGGQVLVVSSDVTDERAALVKLQRSEQRFRALFEHAGVGVALTTPAGHILECNAEAASILGMPTDEIVGLSLFELITGGPSTEPFENYQTAVARAIGGVSTTMETWLELERGRVLIQATVSLLDGPERTLLNVLLDVTEDRRGELIQAQRLARDATRARDRLEAFASAIPDIGFILDETGLYVEVLTRSEELLYSTADNLRGRRLHDVLPKADADLFLATIRGALRSGGVQRLEYALEVQDGKRWFEARVAPLRDVDGPGAVAWVSRDITEQRALEQQLRAAQKMEAIGRLAGGVAHDFNNLLTAILSFAGFARDIAVEGGAQAADIDEVIKAGERAAQLTGQLLAFSRQQPVNPCVLDPDTTIDNLRRMLARLLGEHIEIRVSLHSDDGRILIDPSAFEQVIVNLAVNARDAMPEGGRLTIETQLVRLDNDYARSHGFSVSTGDYVAVSVSDDGVGMDDETQKQIFEPFFTTKMLGEGTGLGLATCYGIAQQAGGFIWVYSELTHGTTFKVYLPCVDKPVGEPEVESEARSLRGKERILVVEDEPQVRLIAKRALAACGYDVQVAASGDSALELLEREGFAFDLVLTDVVMPRMGGMELVDRLRERSPDMKVLFMSGYAPHATIHHERLMSGSSLIQKPFTPSILTRRVRQVLDGTAGTGSFRPVGK